MAAYLEQGRAVEAPRCRCPVCGGWLAFASGFWRWVRLEGREKQAWIPRAECARCGVRHALLPSFLLRRRLDPAPVIGAAVALVVTGAGGTLRAAELAGVPHTTVRDWCRRFQARAAVLVAGLSALVVECGGQLAASPSPLPAQAAVEAVHALGHRLAPVVGGGRVGPWELAGLVCGADLLGTTTSPHWTTPGGRRYIAPQLSASTEERSRAP